MRNLINHRNFLALAILLTLVGVGSCNARADQSTVLTSTLPTYTLGPDDVISIEVVNFSELSVGQITVPPDGNIHVPLIGSIPVDGQTPDQLAATLTKKWSDYVIGPSVTVQLVQKRTETVFVYGFVQHASTLAYHDGFTLLQSLAMCGGASINGDLSQVAVSHKDGKTETVDVSNPESKAGTPADLVLKPDDLIFVPERHTQISVLGEVQHGGSFDYTDKMTVLDALTAAGGVDTQKADLTAATIMHNGVESKLDLEGLLRQGKLDANLPLSPGDRIFVPLIHDRTYVFGAVNKPGYYDYTAGDRILDALNDVGGPTPVADLSKVNIIHIDKANNTAVAQTVDINRILTGKSVGDMTANIALTPGDIVYIPDRRHKTSLSDILSGLGSFSIIGSTVRLLGG